MRRRTEGLRLTGDESETFRRENHPCDRRCSRGAPARHAMAKRAPERLAMHAVADCSAKTSTFDEIVGHDFSPSWNIARHPARRAVQKNAADDQRDPGDFDRSRNLPQDKRARPVDAGSASRAAFCPVPTSADRKAARTRAELTHCPARRRGSAAGADEGSFEANSLIRRFAPAPPARGEAKSAHEGRHWRPVNGERNTVGSTIRTTPDDHDPV